MTLLKALAYFFREACSSLARSWKVSLLAITAITMSLFLGGVFLLASGNLSLLIERWERESIIVAYLETDSGAEDLMRLVQDLEGLPWIRQVDVVSSEAARLRFNQAFPSLSDLLQGWGEDPLPASLELTLDGQRPIEPEALLSWLEALRADPAVSMVDD
ncbi:MAG: permease-like cell division protein FtsX, partial [Acidobacteriota bacterium]